MLGISKVANISTLHARYMNTHALSRAFSSTVNTARSSLRICQASVTASRESPVPVVFANGTYTTAAAFDRLNLPHQCIRNGYVTGYLDMPGFGTAKSLLKSTKSADEIVHDIRSAFSKLPTPPVVVASGVSCLIFQKYLESFPLAGLIMLTPLPPNPSMWVSRLGQQYKLKEPVNPSALLRRLVLTEHLVASDSEYREEWDSDVEAHIATEANEEDLGLCGVDASGYMLALVAKEPVNLEAQPVPITAYFSSNTAVMNEAERGATCKLHELGDEEALTFDAPNELIYSDENIRQQLTEHILAWINRRF